MTRRWRILGLLMFSGASLPQLGCANRLIRELDLLTSPNSVGALFFVPRSNFFGLFRGLWEVFGLI
jgi:hypothetical protein